VYTDVILYPVLFSLFEAAFTSAWLLYGLVYLDMIRSDEHYRVNWRQPVTWVKCAAVFVYFVLAVSLFMWEQVLFLNDPIVKASSLAGPSALFYIVALCYTAIVFWMGVLLVFVGPQMFRSLHHTIGSGVVSSSAPPPPAAVVASGDVAAAGASPTSDETPVAAAEWHQVTSTGASSNSVSAQPSAAAPEAARPYAVRMRLLHSVGPMVVVTICTILNIVAGSIGPFGRTAPSFMFFHAAYNVTVIFWLIGIWPVGTYRFSARRTTSERAPLVSNPFDATERRTDGNEDREAPLFN
jgi:hypothetical protein